MSISKSALRKLRQRLPHHYLKDAGERLSAAGRPVTPGYISQVITGYRFDRGVLNVLIALADEHQLDLKNLSLAAKGEKR